MRIHILGICGTFMGGLAMLARSLGHEVTGSDANVYPPMSTLLEKQGISYSGLRCQPAGSRAGSGDHWQRHDPRQSVR
jgi:UDP-N-acetylmuramate: L-alanyl-gamma-D-glutamyl-meso-diaminopimelate ligase